MTEPKIIADFPKCQACGSEEKVSELGCAEHKASGKIAKDIFTTLKQEIVPIEQPRFAGVMVPCIGTFYDVFGKCVTPRCTRASLVNAPIQMAGGPMPGGNGGGQHLIRH